MEVLLFVLILLTGYHLLVENVFVPYRAEKIRVDLFPLLYRVQEIKDASKDPEIKRAAADLFRTMMLTAQNLESHNLFWFKLWKYNGSPRLEGHRIQFRKVYMTAFKKEPGLKDVFVKYSGIIDQAFKHNSAGWGILTYPVFLATKCYRYLAGKMEVLGLFDLKIIKNNKSFEKYKEYESVAPAQHPQNKREMDLVC